MCGVFFLAGFWLNNIISRFSFFLQAFLTWRLSAPVWCLSGCVTASSCLRLPICSRSGVTQKSQEEGICGWSLAMLQPRPGTIQNTRPGSLQSMVYDEWLHAQSGSGGFMHPGDFCGKGDAQGSGVSVVVS